MDIASWLIVAAIVICPVMILTASVLVTWLENRAWKRWRKQLEEETDERRKRIGESVYRLP